MCPPVSKPPGSFGPTCSPQSRQRGLSVSDLAMPLLVGSTPSQRHKAFHDGFLPFPQQPLPPLSHICPSHIEQLQPFLHPLSLFLVNSSSHFEIQLSEAFADSQAGIYTPSLSGGSAGMEDLGSIPVLRRSPGEGIGYPLQYSGLEKSMDCVVHRVAKSQAQLSSFPFRFFSLNK